MWLKATLKRIRARTTPRTFMGQDYKPGYLQLWNSLRELPLPKEGWYVCDFNTAPTSSPAAVPNFSASHWPRETEKEIEAHLRTFSLLVLRRDCRDFKDTIVFRVRRFIGGFAKCWNDKIAYAFIQLSILPTNLTIVNWNFKLYFERRVFLFERIYKFDSFFWNSN